MDENSLIYSWSFHHLQLNDSRQFSFKEFWNVVMKFENHYNLIPSLLSIRGKGYPNNTILEFDRGVQKLTQNRFQNIDSLSMYTIASEKLDFAFYWKLFCSISISKILGTHLYLGFALESFPDLARVTEEFVKPVAALLKPQYGYSYITSIKEGVVGYSAGYLHTPNNAVLTEDRQESITRWSNHRELILDGKLRDLYLENVVSNTHLAQKVKGFSLRNWIEADSSRGTLQEFIPNLFLWTIPKNSHAECRQILAREGLLIAPDRSALTGSQKFRSQL
jgi:hypothetical protein